MAGEVKSTKKEEVPGNIWHKLEGLNLTATPCSKGALVRDTATGNLQFIAGATLTTDESGKVQLN